MSLSSGPSGVEGGGHLSARTGLVMRGVLSLLVLLLMGLVLGFEAWGQSVPMAWMGSWLGVSAGAVSQWVLVALFVLTYAAVVFEDSLALSRTWLALGGAVLMLIVSAQQSHWSARFVDELYESCKHVGALLVFLMAVMGVVQWINHQGGFARVLQLLWSPSPSLMLVWVSLASFILSAILDNMTTCLLMLTMLKGRLPDQTLRWRFAGMVVVAANAGGVWSPMGDVTSTMLWLGQRVSAGALLEFGFWPSLLHCIVVLLLVLWQMPKTEPNSWASWASLESASALTPPAQFEPRACEEAWSLWVFGLGLLGLLAIPVLTRWFAWGPAGCALLVLALLCLCISPLLNWQDSTPWRVSIARLWREVSHIDLPSVCFIGAILMCMEILGHSGVLAVWAQVLGQVLQGSWNTVLALGLLSAIVDNIPLVSAGMQMFDLVQFPKDDLLWVLLSYCAGTGGSLLIVGSAAGLVAMGQEGLKFNWYMRHFTWKVLLAYGAGAALFALLAPL